MPHYRRHYVMGGVYFFTVVAYRRQRIFDAQTVDILRQAFRECISQSPFTINAMVVLPEHIHCIWTLPPDDWDYSTRWKNIKCWFSREYQRLARDRAIDESKMPRRQESLPRSLQKKGEKGIWQRRFWEHTIKDVEDYNMHMDYIHYNPVKHGLVRAVGEWPYSSFHRLVSRGVYPPSWAGRTDGFPESIGGE